MTATTADGFAEGRNGWNRFSEGSMDTIIWLMAANAVVWLGLGAYLAFMGSRQRGLAARLAQWERGRRG